MQGKGTGEVVARLEKGKGGLLIAHSFAVSLTERRKQIFFPYVVSVKHISHYSLCYSNLDFEKQKTEVFRERSNYFK